ncbi:peptide chain release factor N(5)-glutamine methyltransferase [Paludibacter sp. 221]|uniref:peptide chain release factor N(5)-glutamine methyltransferase n=1 Tax=Paludibacter sp. 221 TaxID=2302939 RepID=UPI0013D16C5C|nr:peptide chain release factor N(5)-glutamine methyltransferase [Paludibacter sp. 221]NDV46391.1 peptide chain release factor N(5)-glutamine methyltransferase [Paludibacter sp. 221]
MQKSLEYINYSLKGVFPESEIRNISFLLIEKITGFSHTQVLLNKSTIFSAEQHKQLVRLVEELKKSTPIQYALGETEFYGLNFCVNKSVLIPRPETEELVEWIYCDSKGNKNLKILDIGTGSGCIAIALKKLLPNSEVTAFDISPEAIDTAQKNAKKNEVEINFKELDILNTPLFTQKWDVIVSNPPYIPESEKQHMSANVLKHEPSLALFVPNDNSLLFYQKIAVFATKHLNNDGKLYFEIHHDSGEKTIELLKKEGFKDIEIRKDLSGNDRMTKACI